jgi:hypothetical protein
MSICRPEFEFNKFCTNGSIFSKYYEYAYVIIYRGSLFDVICNRVWGRKHEHWIRSTVLRFCNKLISTAEEISTKGNDQPIPMNARQTILSEAERSEAFEEGTRPPLCSPCTLTSLSRVLSPALPALLLR